MYLKYILTSQTRAVRDLIYLRQGESGLYPESGYGLTSDPDDFQNLAGFPCSKLHLYEPNCGKMSSRNVEESFKKFMDPDL